MAEKVEYDLIVNGKKAKASIEDVEKSQTKLEKTVNKTSETMSASWDKLGTRIKIASAVATATIALLSKKGLEAEKSMFGLNDSMRALAANLSLMGGGNLEMTAGFVRTAQSAGLSEQAIKKVTEQAIALGRLYPHESTETFIDNLSMLYTSGEAQGYIVDILEQKYGTLDLKTVSLSDKMALLDEKVKGVNEAFEKTPEGKITKIGAAFDIAMSQIGKALNTAGENLRIFDGLLEVFEKFGIGTKEIQDQLNDGVGINTKRDISEMQKLENEILNVKDALRLSYVKGVLDPDSLKEGLNGLSSWSAEVKGILEAGFSFEDAKDIAKGDLKEIEGFATETAKKISSSFESNFTNAFVDGLQKGKFAFNDFANSIISDILRIVIQQQIAAPLAQAFGTFAGGFFAQGGVIGGDSPVQKRFATGGVVTRPTRLASGGLVGERNRAEAVLPLQRTANGDLGVKSMGGSGVIINIENNTGSAINADNISEMMSSSQSGEKQKVINIVLEGINKNTNGIRDMLKGM